MRLELIWREEVVGYVIDAQVDMFHWYGRWEPSKSQITAEFLREVTQAMERWEENGVGVDVYLGPEGTKVLEITGFEEGRIEFLANPGRWE